MDVSIFLAKVIGIYFIIVGIAFLCNAARYKATMLSVKDSPLSLLTVGLLVLIIGALMVAAHNIWVAAWPVVITILGWLTLVKGTVVLLFPRAYASVLAKYLECKVSYFVNMIFVLLLGIFLIYHGFYLGA